MGNTKYTYAVARIRALETSLLTNAVIEQLIACPTAEQALQLLIEKGWGDAASGNDMDAVLNREEEKTWQVIGCCPGHERVRRPFLPEAVS